MNPWTVAEDHARRSDHIRALVRSTGAQTPLPVVPAPPTVIVRFWDDVNGPPADVGECLQSWQGLCDQNLCQLLLFDDRSASRFVGTQYGPAAARAYENCPHPAMRSDLFRLCFLLEHGGAYIDADDALVGDPSAALAADGQLKLQPLCYDRANDTMVTRAEFTSSEPRESWIFYVNNAPIVAPPGHPVLASALERALSLVSSIAASGSGWDIQSTTGPGNLTAALVAYSLGAAAEGRPLDVEFLDWDAVAVSRYPLGYRTDERNWRHWDGRSPVAASAWGTSTVGSSR